MLDWHVTTCKSGITRCHTWSNPPTVAWTAWPRDAVPAELLEQIADVEWHTLCRQIVRRWAWRRRVGRIFGTLVDRARLDSAVERLTDNVVDVAPCVVNDVPGLVLRDAATLVVLTSVADDGNEHPDFADAARAHERSPAFGPLVPILWHDSRGCGPYGNVELLMHAWVAGDACLSLELLGLGEVGSGMLSPTEARRLAGLLTAAADWCDAHETTESAESAATRRKA